MLHLVGNEICARPVPPTHQLVSDDELAIEAMLEEARYRSSFKSPNQLFEDRPAFITVFKGWDERPAPRLCPAELVESNHPLCRHAGSASD